MRKVFIILLCMMLSVSVIAQQKIQLRSTDRAECVKSDMTSLKASFSFSTIEAQDYQTSDRGTFSELILPNTVRGGNEGDPLIPVINELIAVPVGATPRIEVTSYSTTEYNLADYGMKTLVPRQPSLRKDKKPEEVPFVMNEAAYQSTRGLRSEPMAVVSVDGVMRGVQLGKMTIEPVSYDPVNNKIRVFNDIEVEVFFDGADAQATEQMLIDTYSPYFDIVYKSLFNGRAVKSVYDDHPDLYSTPVKMLVVTTSTYANSTPFQNWLTWKKQKGINVDIYTVTSSTSSSTIRSGIQSRYNANHPSFLVIVGDESVVPYYALYDYDSYYGDAATDMEYASVDGDIYHDMFMSRMPVNSTTQLGYLVDKILMYEKYTMPDPSYLNETLLIAGWDSSWTNKVGKPTIQYANNYYFNSSNGITPRVYITTGSNQTTCYNYMNQVGFVNYTAHGDIQEWSDPAFTNSNVNSLTNTNKPFWAMGNCCLSASFSNTSYNPSFGEVMVRAQNKAAFGYIGSVVETYWYEDFYFGVGAFNASNSTNNNPTLSGTTVGAYDALFDDTGFNTLNSVPYIGNVAVSYAYAQNYTSSSSSGCSPGYYWRCYQCFGDGSVMPYLKNPVANSVSHASFIQAGASSFTVNADARSYVSITVNNEIIGVAEVPANATSVSVPLTTQPQAGTTAMVVVTRNQRQPYIYDNVPVVGVGEQYEITATVNPTNAGTVEGTGTYYENTNCTLTAVPNSGYGFTNWSNGSTANPLTVTVTGNASYTANFHALEQHHITYNSQMTHGTISVSPTDAYMGDIVTLTATPDPGFTLDQWDVNTVSKGNVPVENNQFVMPDEAVTVSATFKVADPLTVAGEGGTTSDSHIPFEGLYADDNYQHTQTIYPSSMLTDMQGMQITKLTYYLKTAITTNLTSTFEVRLGTTTQSGFSSGTVNYISMTGSANYTGTIDVTNSSQEVEITLTTPYTYTSGNLVVDVRLTNRTTGYKTTDFLGETGSTYYSVYSKSSSNQPPFTQGTAASFMPKTTFTYEVPQPYISLNPATATVHTGTTQTLTATYGNVTNPTITYSSSNTSVATVTGNGTTATVTGVAPGTATITATMNGTTTATCAITVEDPAYCTPAPTSIDGSGITNVTFGTGLVVNDNLSMTSLPYYYNHSSMIGKATSGSTVEMSIVYATSYTYYTWVWVDWNKNYEFDDDELVYPSTQTISSGTLSLQFDVPASVTPGDYRMRIQGADDSSKKNPCYTGSYSYLVDYTLRVEAPSTDPTVLLSPATATVVIGATETLTATTLNVTGTPNISYTSSNNSVATVTGSGTSATVTGVAVGTATITATMTYNGTNYTATSTITVEEPQYCTPTFGSNTDCITNITLGDINNTTASSSTAGYGDYTSMSTELEPGTTATLSLTSGAGSGTHAAAVWIDFDNSYTFESSERVGTQDNIGQSATVNINLTIPADAPAGSHRMRVVYQYNVTATNIDPCASASYGEAEDYTVVITSPCPKPTGLVLSGITARGVTATWDAEAGDVFQYAMVVGANINPTTVTTYDGSITATGTTCSMGWNNLSPDTDYTLVIRKDCGNDEYSIAVAQSFATEATCAAPTNVTASNLTQSSARINWNGNADSYNVQYATATITGTTQNQIFYDSFENGLDNWTIYIEGFQSTATAIYNITDWHQISSSDADGTSAHTGSYMAMTRSYDGDDRTVDNWLVSPQMTLGDVMTYWVIDDGRWHEHLEVWVSTGTNAISDFVKVASPADASEDWEMRTVDLSAYTGQTGYIAIRHNDTGKDWIFIDDVTVYNTVNTYSYGTFTTLPPTTETSCNITGLSPETLYVAQVEADCGSDGTSRASSVYFTTPDACSAPTDLVTTNITANSATLGWSDNQDSYNVQYRKVYFYEDFESQTLPTGWTTIDANGDGNTWGIGFSTAHSGDNGAYNLSYVYSSDGSVTTTPDDYLVSPQLDLQGTLRVWLSGYAFNGTRYEEHFEILLSTTGNSAADFTTTLVGESTTSNSYVEYTANLSSYAGQKGYIAIHHFNCTDQYYLYVDDFGLFGAENWVTVNPNPTDATVTLTGLQTHTGYEWQVQGLSCNSLGSSTDWSAVATFTTAYPSYTIGIDAWNEEDNDGWYLIASPLAENIAPTQVANMIPSSENNYDLYRFNQNSELEWENYKNAEHTATFQLVPCQGYLYANKNNVTLTFTGAPYNGSGEVTLVNDGVSRLAGWNLIGNPYDEVANIGSKPFYTMNDTRTNIMTTASDRNIAKMEGVFVYTDTDGETVTFTKGGAKSDVNDKMIVVNLSQNDNKVIDRVVVNFSEGETLPKLMLNEELANIYVPQDSKDYAVVRSNGVGDIPVNFKAEGMGKYTFSVNTENVTMAYMHLIDKLTGEDIDLMLDDTYTFAGASTDRADRFVLRFRAVYISDNDEIFAYQSGSDIVVAGKGTLQIFDVLGRFVESHEIDGVQTFAAPATGVYIFKLYGEDMKTQKIVVR